MLMVINESKLDSVFEIFQVREICQYIGQLALFRTFKNIKEVGHVVWTDMLYMGIYYIWFSVLHWLSYWLASSTWIEENFKILSYYSISHWVDVLRCFGNSFLPSFIICFRTSLCMNMHLTFWEQVVPYLFLMFTNKKFYEMYIKALV